MKIENLRFYIKIRTKLGFDANIIFKDLKSTMGESAPSLSTVARWHKLFKGNLESLEDKPRSGKPITIMIFENIQKAKAVIVNDPWCTYDEIEVETKLSRGTIHTIIHEHLKMKKVTSRWVPHQLSEQNKLDRVRICQENLDKFDQDKWRLCDVVTVDESWFYHRQVGCIYFSIHIFKERFIFTIMV